MSALKTFVYVMLTFSDRGRGKGSKCTCCLECIYFTTFDFLHGAYLLQLQNHRRVFKGRPFLCYVHKQDIGIHYSGCFTVLE